MAIAGALVAAPQAQHALARTATVATAQAHKPAIHQRTATATLESIATRGSISGIAAGTRHAAAKAAARNINYKVKSGDTLSGIADRYYHSADDWTWLYHENEKTVQNPDLIYAGQTLVVAALPADFSPGSYAPRHAKPATSTAGTASTATVTQNSVSPDSAGTPVSGSGSGSGSRSGGPVGSGGGGSGSRSGAPMGSGGGSRGVPGGQLNCAGLENLWDDAGGNPAHAFIAAEIAMAESGGNQYALSPTDDYGYWQINISNGALATFDAYGNARSAITLSDDGTSWGPWTTYTSGAYVGRC
jgi:LysM repeat protein